MLRDELHDATPLTSADGNARRRIDGAGALTLATFDPNMGVVSDGGYPAPALNATGLA